MQLFKKILKKLFKRKYIDKKTKDESDYDLLNKILKKREDNKQRLRMLRHKHLELDAFYEIITEVDDLCYTEEELHYIYDNILN